MKPFDWIVLGTLIVLIFLALTGCVSVNVVPTELPLPIRPTMTFTAGVNQVCLSEPDANKLLHYFQQLDAFQAAWERLRATP